MTMIIQNEGTVEAFGLRASRVAVPPSQDQPASDKPPPAGHTIEHVDGDLLQARALARKHPGSPTALARLASSELSFGNRLSSSRAAQRVIQHDAVDAPALLIASQVLLAVGEIGSAEQALHKLLAADTIEGGARSGAAVLAARIAAHQGEPDKALELLTQSNNPAGSALKGTLLVQMGRYHDAIRVLREALSEVPDAPGTLCTLGYAYAAAGSIRKATRATTAAAALDPADRTAGLNLAALFLTQDRAPEAVVAIDRLTAYHPNDIRLVRAAAAALHASGDTARALRRLREMKVTKAARDATPAQREELQLDILLVGHPANDPARRVRRRIRSTQAMRLPQRDNRPRPRVRGTDNRGSADIGGGLRRTAQAPQQDGAAPRREPGVVPASRLRPVPRRGRRLGAPRAVLR